MKATLLLLTLTNVALYAQSANQFPKVEGLQATPAYSHVVVSTPGKIIFVAGQVGVDKTGKVVSGDLQAQGKQAFENVKAALAASGATFDDVVKVNWYVKGYKPEMLPALREVRSAFVNKEHPPASTLIGVAALARDEYLIEVEAIAIIADKNEKK